MKTSSKSHDTEIERRFLVKYLPDSLESYRHQELVTGYFIMPQDTFIRVRGEGSEYSITFKRGEGIERIEIPSAMMPKILIDKLTFDALYAQTDKKHRSEKTRYLIPYKDKIIELNVYHGDLEGFVNVEVEFKSKDEKFEPPDWFGREITDDKRLTNHLSEDNREDLLRMIRESNVR